MNTAIPSLREVADAHIRSVVSRCASLKEAAAILGLAPDALRERRRKLGLTIKRTNRGKATQ